jgi:hypothetical protein
MSSIGGFGSFFLNSPHCLVKHAADKKNSKKILKNLNH